MRWQLVFPGRAWHQLNTHLFPGDGDEHGAVLRVGLVQTERVSRILVRDVVVARDGIDYVQGQRGYRMLTADFVRDQVLDCRDESLGYLAVHCHGGVGAVTFSDDDIASHERGYPALSDIVRGQIVGGIVMAESAVAGDLWLPEGGRVSLDETLILGSSRQVLYPQPPAEDFWKDPRYARQSLLLGPHSQWILKSLKVAVVGAGGVGGLAVEYLARLGVGHIVVIDPERVELTNLPRLPGARRMDAGFQVLHMGPAWFRSSLGLLATRKVRVARRVARQANPNIRIDSIFGDVTEDAIAREVVDSDYLFIAADSMQARLVCNAIVHQYLVPAIQIGTKVQVDQETGAIHQVYSVARPVTPESGCLWCNGLISPERLQDEAATEAEREHQRYVDDPQVDAPSVITLNALATSHAANEFMFQVTGIPRTRASDDYVSFWPQLGKTARDVPRRDHHCPECGDTPQSRRARGDSRTLPTKPS